MSNVQVVLALGAILATATGGIFAVDQRLQDRMESLETELRQEIRSLQRNMPPEWFREQVNRNTERLDRLEFSVIKLEAMP